MMMRADDRRRVGREWRTPSRLRSGGACGIRPSAMSGRGRGHQRHPDPRVDDDIDEIHQQVDQHDEHGEDHDAALDDRIVALGDGADQHACRCRGG